MSNQLNMNTDLVANSFRFCYQPRSGTYIIFLVNDIVSQNPTGFKYPKRKVPVRKDLMESQQFGDTIGVNEKKFQEKFLPRKWQESML